MPDTSILEFYYRHIPVFVENYKISYIHIQNNNEIKEL